jgi:transcriptional regulator with XRE-family HTH domain
MHATQAVIARLESGRVKPSKRTLERLAAATGMRLRITFEPAPGDSQNGLRWHGGAGRAGLIQPVYSVLLVSTSATSGTEGLPAPAFS